MLLQETSYERGRGNRAGRSLTPPCRFTRSNHNSSGRSMSPVPPELPPSPMLMQNNTSHRSSSRSRSPAAIRVRSGESTASGDSSITSSAMQNTGGRTTPTVTFAASTHPQQQQQQQLGSSSHHSHVHFSAMNPNPQLILDDSAAQFDVADLPITTTAPATTPITVAGTGTATSATERSAGTNEGAAAAETVVESETGTASSGPRVNFTFGRAVSWEDQFARPANLTNTATTSSSRASFRSGLSSPSIAPALSPITRSRSNSQTIQFNSTIETITEAAARLRQQQREDGTEGEDVIDSSAPTGTAPTAQDGGQRDTESVGTATRRQASRIVHFSAMREVAVVSTAEAAASSLSVSGMAGGASSEHTSVLEPESSLNMNQNVAPVVHFADDDNYEEELDSVSTFASAVPLSHTEMEMDRVADHLRRLIRRAEEVDSVTLESAFAHFDRSHTGTITPADLQEGLRRLGDSFSDLTLGDCSALLSCLSKKDRRQKLTANNNTSSTTTSSSSATTSTPAINLLGFYRAMGRKSPPLIITSDDPEDDAPPQLRSNAPDGPGNEMEQDETADDDDNDDNESAIQRRIGARLHHPVAVQPPVSLESSHVVHADDAASRLREIVLSAFYNEGTPLESSFRLLDPEGTGYIRANDFSHRIRNLGQDTFSQIIDDEDCQELVALFDANNDGLVSLLDFYRFMGRRSPPPEVTSSDDGNNLQTDTNHDESDDVVEGDGVDAP
eukprot:scaffold107071_cov47-Attheya_sp.AAC.1